MSKPYDATSKDLVEMEPSAWTTVVGKPRPANLVRCVDADISTVTAAADKVIWVEDPEPWILGTEIQSGWDEDLPVSVIQRYGLLRRRHRVPVAFVVMLLRPEANMSALTDVGIRETNPLGEPWNFPCRVIRLWQEPVERWLEGPLGMLPFAPLTNVDRTALPGVISQIKTRFDTEATKPLAAKLWSATYVLMGLRFESAFSEQLLQGVIAMEESTTYQAIIAKGELREIRKAILRLGIKRFGNPEASVESTLNNIVELERLERIHERVLDVQSWQELLLDS